MADDDDPKAGELTTTNYHWTKPTVGASDDQWGGYLNADLDGIDSIVHGIDTRVIPPSLITSDTAPTSPAVGQLWFDSIGGQTYVWFNDGNTSQWVVANNPGVGQGAYLPLNGGTLSGPVSGPSAIFANLSAPQAIGDNRIINGDMRIDQRNNGASGTAGGYTIDRWAFTPTVASKGAWGRALNGVATISTGFLYYLGFQSSSAFTPATGDTFFFSQVIEADAVGDFAWGQSNAQPVTLSFWAYSSLTGTFSGALANGVSTRSYVFSYSLPTANTWTKITITIPGDTGGAWVLSGNAGSVALRFDLGSGATYHGAAGAWSNNNFVGATGAVNVVSTNGAQFLVTGVKLEIGSVATPFNRQSLAKSMADCQRYYQVRSTHVVGGTLNSAVGANWNYTFQTIMRAAPTVTFSMTGGSGYSSPTTGFIANDGFSGQATGTATAYIANCSYLASAEL